MLLAETAAQPPQTPRPSSTPTAHSLSGTTTSTAQSLAVIQSDSVFPYAQLMTRLRDHVQFLASDELRGRAPGTEGNERALRYIVDNFIAYGVEALDSGYFQRFPVLTSVALGRGNKAIIKLNTTPQNSTISAAQPPSRSVAAGLTTTASVETPTGASSGAGAKLKPSRASIAQAKLTWKLGEDYIPLSFSEDSAVSGTLVFVGYGISAKELNYDDYEGINVQGKIVIALRGTPDGQNPHGSFQKFAPLRSKALTAREHGAAALIVVNSSAESVSANGSDELPALRLDRTGNSGIAAIQVRANAINALLPADTPLGALEQRILTQKKPASFEIPSAVMTLSTDLEHTTMPTANVMGIVRGIDSTLAGQYILIGAHCDHLGMGEENSLYTGKEPRIHYGADDNASGTAGMLELAAHIARKPLRRSVVFVAFNAEESGLLGSQWYCKYPRLPLERCAVMLNMDMIGRMKGTALSVHGTGTSSRWNALVDSLGALHRFTISKSADGFGPSDHASFYSKNVPVLFLFTGIHDDYHRPSDTWDKINYPGQTRVIHFAEDLIRTIDQLPTKPDFIKVQNSQIQRSTGFRVYVGTIPDYNDHPKGMKISGVREGSPAQKAGLQEGDVITALGSSRIKNVYDYTYALGTFKPGDTTTVTFLREQAVQGVVKTEELRAELTFEARK